MPKVQQTALSPFSPVELQPLITPDDKKTSHCAVILGVNGKTEQVGLVSRDYKLVTNESVVEVAESLLKRTKLQFEHHSVLFNGRQFRKRYLMTSMTELVRVGDMVGIALDVHNSYDGSMQVGMQFNALRLICSNGMMVSFLLGGFKFKHWGDRDFNQEMLNAAKSIVQVGRGLQHLAPILQGMTQRRVKRRDIQSFFRDTKLPVSMQAKIFDSIEEDTQWGLYNAVTNVLTRQESFHAEALNAMVSRYFLSPN